MGWLFMNWIKSYQDMANHILQDTSHKAIAKALVGSTFYVAYERVDDEGKKDVYIGVFLISRNKGEFGYKDMTENCGPCYYTCPERILKLSTQTSKFSVEWRAVCREYIRRKQAWENFTKGLNYGAKLNRHDGSELTFHSVLSKKYIACINPEGKIYKYDFTKIVF